MEYRHEIVICDKGLNIRFCYSQDEVSRISKHWHNSFEIIYVRDGSLEVELENTVGLLHAGDFILIHPRRIHSTACKNYNSSIVLQVPYPFLQANIPNIQNILFSCSPADFSDENKQAADHVRQDLEQLQRFYQEQPEGYSLKINSILFDLLYVLYRNFTVRQSTDIKKSEKYLERLGHITSYVKEHYEQDISLADAAADAGLSPEYFSRFFKKYMETTFIQYLNTIRLEHCFNEIIGTDYSISDIAERNGFRSYKLFTKLFRYHYGCSPREKRKSQKELKKSKTD